jgi:glyoxylase-like metal-dependent hydrolase (beta-lactamase superfamily II)
MASHTITIGNVELVSLSDGNGDREPTFVFPDSRVEIWQSEYADLLDDAGHLHPRYGSVVARTGGKTVLVDTGLQAADGQLLRDLQDKGIDRNAIDLVVMTHLHPDHVGWNLTGGKPNFPNARYLVPRADWDYWKQPEVLADSDHVIQQVVPLKGMNIMDLMDSGYAVTDELTTVDTPGHTPGHMSLVIASAGERGYILGDVAHNPAQAHYTDWNPIFDIQPDIARRTRHSVLDHLEAEGITVSAGHFPDPGFGKFVRQGGRRVWQGF